VKQEPRRRYRMAERLAVLARQGRCARCDERLGPETGLQYDHIIPLALGGADHIDNLQALHIDCHKAKTTGRRGESRLSIRDGDQQKIAKARRIRSKREREFEEYRRRLLSPNNPWRVESLTAGRTTAEPTGQRPKRKIPSRPFRRTTK
jgi:hypothetical protein